MRHFFNATYSVSTRKGVDEHCFDRVGTDLGTYPASISLLNCASLIESVRAQMQFAVGFKFEGKTEHVVVDAEDALIAALKVKIRRPEVLIAYVRQQRARRRPSFCRS
jgi:hypothetical protein